MEHTSPDQQGEEGLEAAAGDQGVDMQEGDPPDLLSCKESQTDVSSQDIASLTEQLKELKMQNEQKYTPDDYKDPEKVKYFTGLPNHNVLMTVFNFVKAGLIQAGPGCLTPFKTLLIGLMRLRLNMPIAVLSHMFEISNATASRAYNAAIETMYVYLKPLIYWPEKQQRRETMPRCFKTNFGMSVTVIIDCFEIFTERPSDLKARALTWSSYKHHHTAKFLIGITPQGVICFISKAWGGRVSDKYLTENSGFLDKLEPGDCVLADRGFNIADSVASVFASLALPAFTKGKKQLAPHEIESTRKIANVRIHVERVIGRYPHAG